MTGAFSICGPRAGNSLVEKRYRVHTECLTDAEERKREGAGRCVDRLLIPSRLDSIESWPGDYGEWKEKVQYVGNYTGLNAEFCREPTAGLSSLTTLSLSLSSLSLSLSSFSPNCCPPMRAVASWLTTQSYLACKDN